jgi:cyclic beta-1,2-glucan synthetase
VAPCVPEDWPGYRIVYRFGRTVSRIEVRRSVDDAPVWSLDGVAQAGEDIELRDDGGVHAVVLDWPRAPA